MIALRFGAVLAVAPVVGSGGGLHAPTPPAYSVSVADGAHAASAASAASAGRAAADTSFDTVFVVSNRRRTSHGFLREPTDSLWRGLYVVRIIAAANDVPELARLDVRRVDSLALDPDTWHERLQASAARDTSAEGAVLIYVHGYSSNPGYATNQGVQVKKRGDHAGPLVLFLWPAHDMRVTVRSPLKAYREDERAAAGSGAAFALVLREVHGISPNAILVAHSMGNRIALAAAVGDEPTRAELEAHPLRAIGLFSPDVGAEQFRVEFAPELPLLARRVAMYGATTDYLLGASALVNRERRAAGITRRGPPLPGIELVDDTRGVRAEPALFNFIGAKHAVRWASAALADFFDVVAAGAPPSCRVAAGAADSVSVGRWRLKPGARRISALLADCLR